MAFTSQKKKGEGSGSAKLRAHSERSSSSSSSGGSSSRAESPTEYRNRVEAERNSSSSGSGISVSKAPGNSTPSPVKDVEAWKKDQAERNNTQNNNVVNSPHSLGSDPTARTSITSDSQTNVRQVEEGVNLPTERTPLTQDVKTGIDTTFTRGQEKVQGVKVSRVSQKIRETGTVVSEKLNERAGEIQKDNDGPVPVISPYLMRSIGGVADMVSRVPEGTEVFIQRPSLLPEAATIAALGTIDYTVETAKNDPLQLVSDAAVFSAFGSAAGKAGNAIKSRIPAITTGEQGFLLKLKVNEPINVPKTGIEPTIQAEYKGSTFGQDSFNIKKVNTEVTGFEAPKAGMEVLIGETKNGMTDIYVPMNEAQAAALSQQYKGALKNINTPEGSFIEFEPTSKIVNPVYEKSGNSRLSTSTPELIGEVPKTSATDFNNPFRVEQRVNLQKGELKISDSNQLQLPEVTRTINTKGEIVTDFNINDYYKKPEFEKPLQLESGHIPVKRNLLTDESGTLSPRTQFKPKETIIGEMPEMQTKFVRSEGPVVKFKESNSKIDVSNIQNLYDDAVRRGSDPTSDPLKKVSLKRSMDPDRSTVPFIAGYPSTSVKPQMSDVTLPDMLNFPYPAPSSSKSPLPIPAPSPSSSTSGSTPAPEATKMKPSFTGLGEVIPKLKVPKEFEKKTRKKDDKRKQKKSKWEYDRLFNNYKNPLDMDVSKWVK